MPRVVGVQFRPVTKIYYFDPQGFENLASRMPVIVETLRGQELGWVAMGIKEVADTEVKGELKQVLRVATQEDLQRLEDLRSKEAEALTRIRRKVDELGLPMKVVRAEYGFEGRRLLVMFTAEQRVDFHHLVRSLARSFKTRIEMKQIGARDEAKLLDGYGRCGRRLCCSSWLTDFHPVSIRMAKNQDLPLAPVDISGLCGRLLCCLAYENDYYTAVKEVLPVVGAVVRTAQGTGVVCGLNVLKETLLVELESETLLEVPAQEVTVLDVPPQKGKRRLKKSHP